MSHAHPGSWAIFGTIALVTAVTLTLQGCNEELTGSWLSADDEEDGSTKDLAQRIASARAQIDAANARVSYLEARIAQGSPLCHNATCSENCQSLSVSGRWRFGPNGFTCTDPVSGLSHCHCSRLTDEEAACAEELAPGERLRRRRLRPGDDGSGSSKLVAAADVAEAASMPSRPRRGASSNTTARPAEHGKEALRNASWQLSATAAAKRRLRRSSSPRRLAETATPVLPAPPPATPRRLGSPAETITNFCNATGLLEMHGQDSDASEDPSDQNMLESSILRDVVNEMENNNVDQVARDIFTFYICVRWVPDSLFWKVAQQEMAVSMVDAVVDDGEDLNQAISELYQRYKFVPLLCSENVKVFDVTDEEDNTYFRSFSKEVQALASWVSTHSSDLVATRLKEVDEIFCGDTNMNDATCLAGIAAAEGWQAATSWLGSWGYDAETTEERYEAMYNLFDAFSADQEQPDSEFGLQVAQWRTKFPFHGFVHKPEGLQSSGSPLSAQRFLVCFGKRVASDLHRRPAGQHIMTDQNNLGCHGFWNTTEVGDMLNRMAVLWRPPTCQLADMTYKMKKEILKMFSQMNRRLFDALPSMIMDEDLTAAGLLEAHTAGPPPFDPQSVTDNSELFVDGMRVRATELLWEGSSLCSCWLGTCTYCIDAGEYGTVAIASGNLGVVWDETGDRHDVGGSKLEVVPKDWDQTSWFSFDLAAGMRTVMDWASVFRTDMTRDRYTSLAHLMSGSVSKWAVCPVRGDVNHTELDSHLGVEDAAFQDFQREAYSAWTGYEGVNPGEECLVPDFFSVEPFPGAQICEIAELHADHIEKYTNTSNVLEEFLCPVKASMPAPEQLTILAEHDTCLLHMTPEQMRQYQWPYNRDHPARRQFDRKPNMPGVEYELIKLQHVPETGMVSYARTCSPDQLLAHPRFCSAQATRQHNRYQTAAELAMAVGAAVVGALGMGSSSIATGIYDYASVLQQENVTQLVALGGAAELLGEQLWDGLTGAGRLLSSSATSVAGSLTSGLPGASQRDARLEAEIFQESSAGLMLHTLSYQHSIGTNGRTSNAKERYQRFVVTMPCPNFNPTLEFTLKKTWSAVALRMVQTAIEHASGDALQVLAQPVLMFALRGEGRLFHRQREQSQEDDTWYTYGAAMTTLSGTSTADDPPECVGSFLTCAPADDCEWSGNDCVPKVQIHHAGWNRVSDQHLIETVAPGPSTGSHPVTDLKSVTARLYCGEKQHFESAGSGPRAYSSFEDCLRDGVIWNARRKATQPWKLYIPREIVVVAIFSTTTGRQCQPESGTSYKDVLCASGAQEVTDLAQHLSSGDTSSMDGNYMGLHAGASFPRGTPYEVHMKPEDVLEVAGLLSRE